jgi:hypothetical protein
MGSHPPEAPKAEEGTVKIRTAQATTVVLFALVMGVFWGT